MNSSKSLTLARKFLGKEVEFVADHMLGSHHHKYNFLYEANYGHIPNTKAPDGDELDAYFLGVDKAIEKASGTAIAIVHRLNDDDDKVVIVPTGVSLKDEEISKMVNFQEQWSDYQIIRN